jgi:O-6-methylguanine DNA methyltransferase
MSGITVFLFQVTTTSFSRLEKDPTAPVDLSLQAVFSDRGLCQLSLVPGDFPGALCIGLENSRHPDRVVAAFERLKEHLFARLNGERADMAWEEFDLRDCPKFHVRVWKALHAIPFGQTRTYGELAKAAGSPRASRACGQACGANPILLFIPCHRAVATAGLGGFSSGLRWKKRLLALEGVDWRNVARGTRG